MARFNDELQPGKRISQRPGDGSRPKKGLGKRVWSYALGIIIESLAVVGICLLAWGLMAIIKAIAK